jgi:nitrilase
MQIAAIQMVSGARLDDNLQAAAELLAQAAHQGAELALLPEYFCCMGLRDTDKLAIQEPFGSASSGPIQDFLAAQARTLGIWIVGGTLPLASARADKVYNSSLAFDPQGRCVARYDKLHLFRFDNGREAYDESRVLLPGAQPVECVLCFNILYILMCSLCICVFSLFRMCSLFIDVFPVYVCSLYIRSLCIECVLSI